MPARLLFLSLFAATAAMGCETMKGMTRDDASMSMRTSKFEGVKANTGTAAFMKADGKRTLTWSDDFTIPDTPAPHWQVVDSRGTVYLPNRLLIKDDKKNRTVELPSYVRDVAKVQIWCAFAEVLLGEASFEKAVR